MEKCKYKNREHQRNSHHRHGELKDDELNEKQPKTVNNNFMQ